MAFHDPAHAFEVGFWGDCTNTFGEEEKQFVYAERMGLAPQHHAIDAAGKRILDIGGGPVSMLLKCRDLGAGMVIDPIRYPDWVYRRYDAKGIQYLQMDGEAVYFSGFDEVWIYNVLQHCIDPATVIRNARAAAPVLRIFEWLDFPPHPGHPHMLTESAMNEWCGGRGTVKHLAERGCYGNSYAGVFSRADFPVAA